MSQPSLVNDMEKVALNPSTPREKVQTSITQPSYSPGSRSSHHERSRSKQKNEKKHKHKHHKHRSKSKEKRRNSRSLSKDRKKHKHHKERKSSRDKKEPRQESSQPTEIPMPLQVSMPPIPGQRRKRQRSRSPLNYYRRHQNGANDGEFWDSFTWVPRMNYTPTVSMSALATTKKMRRLMITNIPYEIGITEEDLRNLITRYMSQNYLKDNMNNCPVVNLEIDQVDRNAAVELSSVEETCRVSKLQKIELFKGIVNGIIRLGDSCYGSNILTQAQTAAQAQAAAFAAINVLENKKTQFSVDTLKNNTKQSSTVLRVVNAVTPYMASHLSKEEWEQYEQDLLEGFSQFGKLVHHWLVTKEEKEICADPGNLFVQFESKSQAEKAMEEMQGRMYDQRAITLYFVPRNMYYQNFKKGMTPPPILEKK